MMKKSGGLFFLLMIGLGGTAQQYFDSLLTISATKYPLEKIYIQTDRSYYIPGEMIWFKAYISAQNNPIAISKTLYADLVNQNGEVLQRKTLPVLQGGAASFFELSATEQASKLFIRAYTSWMLNFDNSLICLKPISLIHKKSSAKIPVKEKYFLSLFPEGGDLVKNIPCRIAFKANNQEGIPIDVKGSVINYNGKELLKFNSTHDGMGYFDLIPTTDESYIAKWTDPANTEHQIPLPAVKDRGINLHVENRNGQLKYTIIRPDSAAEEFLSYTVMAQMNQQTVYSAKINLHRKKLVTAPIPTDSLPDGVVQITVFNALQQPVAERIAFVNNNNYSFTTDLHALEKNITKHGRTVLQIDVGGKLISNLSVAVTDAELDKLPANIENIYSSLLLSSDCKGYIYNPAGYFSSDEDSLKQQLDLVMMTNGWRRFKWENMISGKWPVLLHQPENYLSIKGKIYGLNKNLLKNRSLNAIFKTPTTKASAFFNIPVEEDGKFYSSGLYFFDTLKLYYQFNNDKDKILTNRASFSFETGTEKAPPAPDSVLSFIPFYAGPDSSTLNKSTRYSNINQGQLLLKNVKTLQNVTVKSKQKPLKDKLEDEYTSGLFKGGDARTFTIEDDVAAQSAGTVLDYLQGKVAGMQINTYGEASITRRGHKTDVFLDESSVDLPMLQSINMRDVAMIKIFDPPFIGAIGGGAGGAVAVYTKKGGGGSAIVTGLNQVMLYGYSTYRQFYMPDYEKTNAVDEADYRSTLYWNPFLIFDQANRRITIPVFNSDNCKKMRVVIEGMNESGQLTREEKIFE